MKRPPNKHIPYCFSSESWPRHDRLHISANATAWEILGQLASGSVLTGYYPQTSDEQRTEARSKRESCLVNHDAITSGLFGSIQGFVRGPQ